ncbi:PAS domain S-box protein [Kaarinaea lacus]
MSPEEFCIFARPLPDAMCLVTTRGQILAANEATSRFIETDINTLRDMTLFDLVADREEKVEQTLRNWSRSRVMIPGPLKLRTGREKITPCNCSGSLIQQKTADSSAIILVRFERREHFTRSFTALNNKIAQLQKEITVRQRTEQALAKSKAEFEAMFNSIPDAVMFADTERRIIMNNPAVHSLFGYSDQELIGNTTEMLYADRADYVDQGRRRYRTGPDSEYGAYEVKYKRKDGSVFWSESLGTQVKNTEGKIIGFIGLFRDITERKKTEEELLKHREHLEELVKERTVALENSNKELESYSYSIAHDLRAPLRSIVGFSQIILEDTGDKLDSVDREHLQRIVKSAAHMAELIDDILKLSRVSRSDMQLTNVNLSDICLEISKTLCASNPDRRVEWSIQPDLTVLGDHHLLYIVMSNLLANSWKFTQKQSQALIEFGCIDDAGEKVFYVRDNGVGFDMKYCGKIFGLFQRLHHTDDYEGTGVGLATVQRIIDRHKGWIRIEGAIGKGATVYFSIPEKLDVSQ